MSVPFYGQHDPPVDRIIEELLPPGFGPGVFVDVGAGCGIQDNNSYHFEQLGWTCICVEPNPFYAENLTRSRRHVALVAVSDCSGVKDFTVYGVFDPSQFGAISGLVTDERLYQEFAVQGMVREKWTVKVAVHTLDRLLVAYDPPSVDVLSIDTEGTETDVLLGFNTERWLPKVVVIEDNWDTGMAGKVLRLYGYERVRRNVVNDFYVRKG